MSANARAVLALLLVGVSAVGIGLAVLAFPDASEVPEPIEVALDFEPFVPGVEQTIRHTVDVPVAADVVEAGLLHSTGLADRLAVEFGMCRAGSCVPMEPGAVVAPGATTIVVTAVLDAPVGSDVDMASGRFAGRILLAEVPTSGSSPISSLWLLAVLVGAGLVLVVATSRYRVVRS